jgi:dihydrofolate reductase
MVDSCGLLGAAARVASCANFLGDGGLCTWPDAADTYSPDGGDGCSASPTSVICEEPNGTMERKPRRPGGGSTAGLIGGTSGSTAPVPGSPTSMSKLRVHSFSISLDGFGAGPCQDLNNPLGVGGEALHEWVIATRTFQRIFGNDGGTTGIDDDLAARGFKNVGAWIMGRNMFGPIRGPWPDDAWKGWWGDNPPYHSPVFVLTHRPRQSISMDGGTTFHFVTEGIHAALQRAVDAASGLDVRIGGGVATVQQYLHLGLIDEMHLAISPVLLGSGERLFLAEIDLQKLGYDCTEHIPTPNVTHVTLSKNR